MNEDTHWFHEDDYCQREVLPRSNLAWCQAQNWKILEFADAHAIRRDGRIVAYTDMYVRPPIPTPLSTLRMPRDTLASVLGRTLPRTDEVRTGTASGPGEPCPRTFGFRGLFADWDEDGIVQHIWAPRALLHFGAEELDALIALTPAYPLMFVDWTRTSALPISGAMPDRDAFFDGLWP